MRKSNLVLVVASLILLSCGHEKSPIRRDQPVRETKTVNSSFLEGKWKITQMRITDVFKDKEGYHREFILSKERFQGKDTVIVEFCKNGMLVVKKDTVGVWLLKDEHYIDLHAEPKNLNQPLLLNSEFYYNKKRTYMNLVCKLRNSSDHSFRITYVLVHESRW